MPMPLPCCQKNHQSYLQISKSAIYSLKLNISYILSNNMGSQPMFLYNYINVGHFTESKSSEKGLLSFWFLNVKIQIIFANEEMNTFHMQGIFYVSCKFYFNLCHLYFYENKSFI